MKQIFTLLLFFLTFGFNSSLLAGPFHLEKSPFISNFVKVKRMMLVEAEVDDRKGYFLVDTGADALVLNEQHFQDYESVANMGKYRDINGRKRSVEFLHIDEFRWGDLTRSDFYVQRLDFSAVERVLEVKLLGLMGYEVFRQFELAIDYDNLEIVLNRLDEEGTPYTEVYPSTPAYTMDFILNEHLATLEVDFGGEEEVEIGLDSGSTINILDRKWRNDLKEASHRKNRIRFMGANASRKTRDYYTIDQLEIEEQFAIRYWKAAVGKLSHFEDIDIHLDGILGINFFQVGRVAINYEQQQIRVWPNDNAIHWRFVNLNENLVRKNPNGKAAGASNDR